MEKKSNIDEAKAKKISKVLLCVGIPFLVVGIVFFGLGIYFSMNGDFDMSFLPFIGIPFVFIGAVCIMFGILRATQKFVVSSTASVQKDYVNYMLDGTSDSAKDFASNVASDINDGKTCPHCGNINLNDAKYCSQCGEKLPSNSFCPSCGKENDPDAKYCKNCGKRL